MNDQPDMGSGKDELPPALKHEPRSEKSPLSDPEMQDVHAQLMREKEEPREGFPPVPIALLFLFSIVIFVCGIYMGKNSAGFRWDVYDPNFDPAMLGQVQEAPAFDPIARGERVFSQQCAQCHQGTGMGVPGVYPPLVGARWVVENRVKPTAILINGLVGEIEVMGNVYNGNMPAFAGILSDRDIGAVLTYIRQAWGNDAGPISEEQVAEARALYGSRASPWGATELLDLPELETILAIPEVEEVGEAVEAEEEDSGDAGTVEAAPEEEVIPGAAI
ncbi:MAG: cytochrome c [Verrucomicrobiota bacterium]